nr:probable ADP-ribosylation factor GTPase-activating protein AGD14 isoform X1 [Tanacetum cinerariifolium]
GPQYVCTSFWTFVCTTCSGIHREFTHRVKSVSMAKFTSQEVSALQGGRNSSAKEIYFKEWDAQRQSFPDSSNVERLRDFIKHVYVDRRYSGERSLDKPLRAKTGEVEGYDQDFKKSPARIDVVNDWRREDRFGNGRRSDDGGSKVEGRSPDRQSNPDMSSPPITSQNHEMFQSREMLDCQKIQYDLLKAEQERMKTTQEAHTEKLDQVAKSQSSLEDDLKQIQDRLSYYSVGKKRKGRERRKITGRFVSPHGIATEDAGSGGARTEGE